MPLEGLHQVTAITAAGDGGGGGGAGSDEPGEALGEAPKLPPQHEPLGEQRERTLTPRTVAA